MILRFKKINPILSFFKIYKDVILYSKDNVFWYDENDGLFIEDIDDNTNFNYKKYDYYFIQNTSDKETDRFLKGVGFYLDGVYFLDNALYDIRKQYMAFFKVRMKNGASAPTVSNIRRKTNRFEFALNACIFSLDLDLEPLKDKKINRYIHYIGYGSGDRNIKSSRGIFSILDFTKIKYIKLKP